MKKARETSMVKSSLWGIGTSVVTAVILSMVSAWLIMSGKLSQNAGFWVGIVITGAAVLIGGLVGAAQSGEKTLIVAAVVFAGYTLLMMLVGFIAYGTVSNAGFYNLPAGLIAVAAVCLTRAGKGKRHHR